MNREQAFERLQKWQENENLIRQIEAHWQDEAPGGETAADLLHDRKTRLHGIRLCDFRTIEGERILALISKETGLSHRSLLHIKHFLSGVFTYAKQTGVFDGINPVMNVSVPKGAQGNDTYAYTLEEIHAMPWFECWESLRARLSWLQHSRV